tara:strand:+ start:109 stop:966 length:858 start_codon:yes stop_codon:yes gene_type:complete
MINKIKTYIQLLFNFFDYKIESKHYKKKYNLNDINLNIGSGGTSFPGFKNLDKLSWRSKNQKNFVSYDIVTDEIPFENNSVSNIYCSNVIEHLEDKHIKKFFYECLRVLKNNGVLRLITPDPEYIFNQVSFKNSYLDWFKRPVHIFNKKNFNHSFAIENLDCFIFHFAIRKSRFYQKKPDHNYYNYLKTLNYENLMIEITKDLKFEEENIHHHINFFDFKKLKKFLEYSSEISNLKNYAIIRSKKNGSVSSIMRENIFDYISYPRSLFVDYVKSPDIDDLGSKKE